MEHLHRRLLWLCLKVTQRVNENIRIVLNDDLLGLGLSEFEFQITDIKNTPNLIIY